MRGILAIILFAVSVCTIFLSYSHLNMEKEENTLMERENKILETSYKAVTQMYRISIENYVKYAIMQKEVLDILRDAKYANEEKKAIYRGSLYRLLYPFYNNELKKAGINNFHFHTTLGESFLRFHSPTDNGDTLFDIRPSIKIANIDKKMVFGFEGGRSRPGLCYVFPIIYEGQHLGSVELTMSYVSIENEIAKLLTSQDHALLLKKDVATDLVFENHKQSFIPSSFSNAFVIENEKLLQSDDKTLKSPLVDTINAFIKEKYPIEKLLLEGKNFSIPFIDKEHGYIANFHAIYDVSNTLAAYAITYASQEELVELRKKYKIVNIFGLCIIFLFSMGIYLFLRQNQKILFEKIQFETIVLKTVNGVLLLNTDGTIKFMNPGAAKMLGYKPDDIIGQNAHEVIHVHEPACSKENCRVLRSVQTNGSYIGEEVLRKKNGEKITVHLNANAFIQGDKSIGSVVIIRDITQEKKDKELIEHLAYYDALTDLPNRKLLLDRLSQAISISSRSLEFCGLLFIDLDNFKTLNDTQGHDVGDALLKEVAIALKGQLRSCDTVARFGGDEFVVLLTKLGNTEERAKEELYMIGYKLLQAVSLSYRFSNSEYTCTASIGGTLFLDGSKTINEILKDADTAMYIIKNGGKNEIKIF